MELFQNPVSLQSFGNGPRGEKLSFQFSSYLYSVSLNGHLTFIEPFVFWNIDQNPNLITSVGVMC